MQSENIQLIRNTFLVGNNLKRFISNIYLCMRFVQVFISMKPFYIIALIYPHNVKYNTIMCRHNSLCYDPGTNYDILFYKQKLLLDMTALG